MAQVTIAGTMSKYASSGDHGTRERTLPVDRLEYATRRGSVDRVLTQSNARRASPVTQVPFVDWFEMYAKSVLSAFVDHSADDAADRGAHDAARSEHGQDIEGVQPAGEFATQRGRQLPAALRRAWHAFVIGVRESHLSLQRSNDSDRDHLRRLQDKTTLLCRDVANLTRRQACDRMRASVVDEAHAATEQRRVIASIWKTALRTLCDEIDAFARVSDTDARCMHDSRDRLTNMVNASRISSDINTHAVAEGLRDIITEEYDAHCSYTDVLARSAVSHLAFDVRAAALRESVARATRGGAEGVTAATELLRLARDATFDAPSDSVLMYDLHAALEQWKAVSRRLADCEIAAQLDELSGSLESLFCPPPETPYHMPAVAVPTSFLLPPTSGGP